MSRLRRILTRAPRNKEETVLGIAQFQTNALIAASADAYSGTVARKATQHVFLSEFGL